MTRALVPTSGEWRCSAANGINHAAPPCAQAQIMPPAAQLETTGCLFGADSARHGSAKRCVARRALCEGSPNSIHRHPAHARS